MKVTRSTFKQNMPQSQLSYFLDDRPHSPPPPRWRINVKDIDVGSSGSSHSHLPHQLQLLKKHSHHHPFPRSRPPPLTLATPHLLPLPHSSASVLHVYCRGTAAGCCCCCCRSSAAEQLPKQLTKCSIARRRNSNVDSPPARRVKPRSQRVALLFHRQQIRQTGRGII